MKLINDIINELVDPEKSLTSALLKTKVLANKIKNQELLSWVNSELSGYEKYEGLPSYRIRPAQVIGTFINENYQHNHQSIPTSGLPKEWQSLFLFIHFQQSVEALEELKNAKNSGSLKAKFPAELCRVLEESVRKMGNPTFALINAEQKLSSNAVTQILSEIRNMLLNFTLKLDEEFGNLTQIEDLKSKKEIVDHIVNNYIITTKGDGNVINTGDHSSVNSNATVRKGSKEDLRISLYEKV